MRWAADLSGDFSSTTPDKFVLTNYRHVALIMGLLNLFFVNDTISIQRSLMEAFILLQFALSFEVVCDIIILKSVFWRTRSRVVRVSGWVYMLDERKKILLFVLRCFIWLLYFQSWFSQMFVEEFCVQATCNSLCRWLIDMTWSNTIILFSPTMSRFLTQSGNSLIENIMLKENA